jgi:hypothetical protein
MTKTPLVFEAPIAGAWRAYVEILAEADFSRDDVEELIARRGTHIRPVARGLVHFDELPLAA